MPGVQFGPPVVRLRARRAHLRRMRPRPDRPDDRPGARVACVRRRTGREARTHRRADDVHDPRQRALDDDRLEEQGLIRQIDPDAEPRPAVSPPEMATTDPSEQRDGTQPRVRAERARPDGQRHGAAAKRPRDGRDGVPEGREQGPDPSAGGRRGVAAAAIYIASILCNERRTQREVADVAGVTEVTIRNRYKELTEKLGIKVEL